jgi:hypothetical protein
MAKLSKPVSPSCMSIALFYASKLANVISNNDLRPLSHNTECLIFLHYQSTVLNIRNLIVIILVCACYL